MKFDSLLNKKLFKLFGFPIYGWLIAMLLIFGAVYLGGKQYIDYKKEREEIYNIRQFISVLKTEHQRRIDLLEKNFEEAAAFKDTSGAMEPLPAINKEKLKAPIMTTPDGTDDELKKLQLYQSELEIYIQKVLNKNKEVAYWMFRNNPAVGAAAAYRTKDTLYLNAK